MHKLQCAPPCPALKPFVLTYAQRDFDEEDPLWIPVPARLEQMIELELGAPIGVSFDHGVVASYSSAAVGLHIGSGCRILLSGKMCSFGIFFQPTGLSRLFQIPVCELTNHAFEGSSVLGGWLESLRSRLAELPSFGSRVRLVEGVLIGKASEIRSGDPMLDTLDRLFARQGAVSMLIAAAESKLSLRQFERIFQATAGIPPKLYTRIARFQCALDAKVAQPAKTWTQIAHELNYHDQMHMIHDFRIFAGETPGGVLTHLVDQRPSALMERGELHEF